MTRSQIFTAAWTIARREAVRLTVTVRSVFGAALKQAWAASKQPANIVRTFSAYKGKAWVAALTGRDSKFGFVREFLGKRDVTASRSNTYREIEIAIELREGTVFEWSCQESASRNERGYSVVRGGKLTRADRAEVEAIFA